MSHYMLTVLHEGASVATETIYLKASAEVLDTIPKLLAKHPGCHRIHVYAGQARLFSVDCEGRTTED